MIVRTLLAAFAAFALAGPAPAQTKSPSPPGCPGAENHQLDFWIGKWEVYPTGKTNKVADSLIEAVYHGCGIRENWMPLVPGGGGGSLSGYVPAEHAWKQTWLDSAGSHVEFVGGWDGQKMAITGDWVGPTNPPGTHNYTRMMYAPNPDGSVRQWGEASPDGKTWAPSFDLTYRKAKS